MATQLMSSGMCIRLTIEGHEFYPISSHQGFQHPKPNPSRDITVLNVVETTMRQQLRPHRPQIFGISIIVTQLLFKTMHLTNKQALTINQQTFDAKKIKYIILSRDFFTPKYLGLSYLYRGDMHNVSKFLYKTQKPNHRNKEPTPPSMPFFLSLYFLPLQK